MPEINYGEMLTGQIKALSEQIDKDRAARLTADEARKKELDAEITAVKAELAALKEQKKNSDRAAIPGLEYGSKGEPDKPTWTRLLQAIAEPERLKRTEYGPEKDMIDHVRKTAINAATGAAGGFLVPTTMQAGILPELRERSIARMAGATVITGLSPGSHEWVRSKGGITATHINTEGEESGTESVPTFDQIVTRPRTAITLVPMTRGMMTQTAESVEGFVRSEIAKVIALFEDKQFFVGTGAAGAPRGIFNHPSIGAFTFTETSISTVWQSLIDAVLDVRNANAIDQDRLAWVCEPAARFWLAKILDLNGRPLFDTLLSGGPATTNILRQIMSYPLFDSSQINNASAATANFMFGPWSFGTLAEWSTLELALNTESDTNFLKARATIRGLFDYDCAFFQPQAFTKATGFDSTAAIPATL